MHFSKFADEPKQNKEELKCGKESDTNVYNSKT